MTLPATTLNGCEEDSDMFGPPRTSPPISYRSRVPMISPKLRLREERKRVLQLCAHKLERIKDSETNLRRSVCINNTYCRLTDELRREKQSRYSSDLPKLENKSEEIERDNIFKTYNRCEMDSDYLTSNKTQGSNAENSAITIFAKENEDSEKLLSNDNNNKNNCNTRYNSTYNNTSLNETNYALDAPAHIPKSAKRHHSVFALEDNDFEIDDNELNPIISPLLIDPEITQGAEQLEKAMLSSTRKRFRTEDESSRNYCQTLSQVNTSSSSSASSMLTTMEDCILDQQYGADNIDISMSGFSVASTNKHVNRRLDFNTKLNTVNDLDLNFELSTSQKDFEVIIDALRLGSTNNNMSSMSKDSCGQAAMMLSESTNVFHNLVVTSLET